MEIMASNSESHSARKHSPCSASGSNRWINCPGSVGLNATLPDEPSNKYAVEGTTAHELAEKALKKWIKLNQVWLWHDAFVMDEVDYSDEMKGYVLTYIKIIQGLLKEFDINRAPSIRIEAELVLDKSLAMQGIADLAITGLRGGVEVGMIIDLKYGKTPIKAKENSQLAYYACALKNTSTKRLHTVDVIVVQPRVEDGVTRVSYSEESLELWHKMLTRAAEKAYWQMLRPSLAEFQTGSWCKWCPAAKSACKAKNPDPDKSQGLEFIE